MNQFLLGVGNGVVDLHKTSTPTSMDFKVEYRIGKASDHVSFQVGKCLPEFDALNYIEYDPSDPIYEEIDDFFSKVFPRPDLRAYVWRLLASCLEGANKEQCFYIWIGVGGNGKSKLVELMRIILGDYCCSLQSTSLTRKRPESGAANPDIMAIRNKRFIYLQEPDDREPLNTSRMKQFSGEDMVEARGLFEDQTRFKVSGKLHMMCNKLPPITTMDRGTWRRVRVIPFESKFVDPESPDLDPSKNVYPRDDNLDQKMSRWREAMFAKLLHIYQTEYLKSGLNPIPQIVTQASEQYKESFDVFAKFFKACVRQGGTAVGSETPLKDFLAAYKSWHDDSGSGNKLSQTELTKRLTETLGEPQGTKGIFRHVRVFKYEDDAEEFDKDAAATATAAH
jgi:P4 family phage/plasmid primase-like protien